MELAVIADFLSARFSLVLFLSFLIGVAVPGFDTVPTHVITFLVAVQIFCSCFKVELADVRDIHVLSVAGFYLVRFVVLPSLIFLVMEKTGSSTPYGVALFLMLLLPAGVSAPAFTAILGGNVSLALFLVIISSLLCPFVVPGLFQLLAGASLDINTGQMFTTMAVLIFIPILLHLPCRRSQKINFWFKQYQAVIGIPCVAATVVLALAKQREFLMANWQSLISTLALSLLIYFVFYGVGWVSYLRAEKKSQIAVMLSSGLNNISLGIVLSALYFEPDVAVFMVVANVSWVIAVMPVRKALVFFSKRPA